MRSHQEVLLLRLTRVRNKLQCAKQPSVRVYNLGVRIGTPALTARGFKEEEFKIVAKFLHRALLLGLEIQEVDNASSFSFSLFPCLYGQMEDRRMVAAIAQT